jgi:UDP:flavonoid glycosyltransferase YjiC (YdhE family)
MWGGGGNLPPLLAAARLLAARGFVVHAIASTVTAAEAERCGFRTYAYQRAPEPDMRIPFEAQARRLLREAAGIRLARDVLALTRQLPVDVLLVDCMLPGALAAGDAAGVPTASIVHFPYAAARSTMTRGGGPLPLDRATLDATRRRLGLSEMGGELEAWESPDLLLVTLPRWFDAPGELPAHVVHAGPLGVHAVARAGDRPPGGRALLSFSTTVMEGQRRLVEHVCAAVELAGLQAVLTLGPAMDRSFAPKTAAVEVVEWADHDELLARCDVVVTHGGLGTTLRALAHGRPLLVLPLGRDQHFNATRVDALGAGLVLHAGEDPRAIADALARLVAERGFRDAARRAAARIAAERPEDAAADVLERLPAVGS